MALRGRIVVTGGAGFLGSHLCQRLLQDGHEVVCIDNFLTSTRANLVGLDQLGTFAVLEADITAPIVLPGPVAAVLHFASPASPTDYMRLPIQTLRVGSVGTMNALDLARDKSARFILASTSEVYGDPLVHPQPETYWGNVNAVGPRGVYDEAKRFGEAATAAYRNVHAVRTSIVRIFNTFGPRMRADDGRAIPTFIRQGLTGEPLTVAGDGSQTRSVCFVSDLVEGITRLLESGHPGPMNIGNPSEITILELAKLVRELTGSRSDIAHIPIPVDDPQRRRPDVTLARRELDWQPEVPLKAGLLSTIHWFKARQARTLGPVR